MFRRVDWYKVTFRRIALPNILGQAAQEACEDIMIPQKSVNIYRLTRRHIPDGFRVY